MDDAERIHPSPIIVLGALRTGTSLVAQMIHRWGAYAGDPEQLTSANEHNPQGYWEYKPIWDLLLELGELRSGVSWWDPTFQERVKGKLALPHYKEQALAMISDMARPGRPWVWKDPALSLYLPFWKELWGDPVYVITVRHPYDTARSLQRFIMPPKLEDTATFIAGNLLRWQYMLLLILEHTEGTEKKIFVSYEEVVEEPQRQAQRLSAFLTQHYPLRAADKISPQWMAEAVDPALWRNRSSLLFEQVEEATAAQKALYQFLQKKVKDPLAKFEQEGYPMSPGWLEFVNNEEALIGVYSRDAGQMG